MDTNNDCIASHLISIFPSLAGSNSNSTNNLSLLHTKCPSPTPVPPPPTAPSARETTDPPRQATATQQPPSPKPTAQPSSAQPAKTWANPPSSKNTATTAPAKNSSLSPDQVVPPLAASGASPTSTKKDLLSHQRLTRRARLVAGRRRSLTGRRCRLGHGSWM